MVEIFANFSLRPIRRKVAEKGSLRNLTKGNNFAFCLLKVMVIKVAYVYGFAMWIHDIYRRLTGFGQG